MKSLEKATLAILLLTYTLLLLWLACLRPKAPTSHPPGMVEVTISVWQLTEQNPNDLGIHLTGAPHSPALSSLDPDNLRLPLPMGAWSFTQLLSGQVGHYQSSLMAQPRMLCMLGKHCHIRMGREWLLPVSGKGQRLRLDSKHGVLEADVVPTRAGRHRYRLALTLANHLPLSVEGRLWNDTGTTLQALIRAHQPLLVSQSRWARLEDQERHQGALSRIPLLRFLSYEHHRVLRTELLWTVVEIREVSL